MNSGKTCDKLRIFPKIFFCKLGPWVVDAGVSWSHIRKLLSEFSGNLFDRIQVPTGDGRAPADSEFHSTGRHDI